MADETNTPAEPNEPVANPIEAKAMEQGWRPKEEWEGPPEQWRDAQTFLDRGELFGKIDAQRGEIKQLKAALVEMRNHNLKIAEVEYKRALADLKSQKRDALAEGNVDAVMALDDQIDTVKEAAAQHAAAAAARPVETESEVRPMFNQWLSQNQWFEKDRVMRAYANDLGKELAANGLSPAEVLDRVTKEVKAQFPDKFTNPNRAKPSAVEGSTNKGGRSSPKDYELTDVERRVMQRLVNTVPGFTKEKYIADLKKIKGE
jgi:hypothetical protein